MMQPGEPARLPHWCSIAFSSKPDDFYGHVGADSPDEGVTAIVDYIRRAGDGQVRVNEARIRVRPPGGADDASPAERTVEYLNLDRVWPLTDDRIASLGALLRHSGKSPSIDLRVTFEAD
jgi:hypothetical protein